MAQGTHGELKAWNDFLAPNDTVVLTGSTPLGGEVSLIGVNEGSITAITDEPGGLLLLTTDTADNDNHLLIAGPFVPADGGIEMECRFKLPASGDYGAIWAGLAELDSLTAPTMPTEHATTTMTYNPGGALGVQYDYDSTTKDFRFVACDGGAALAATPASASRLTAGLTADLFYIVRVEMKPDGMGRVYFGDQTSAATLKLVGTSTAPVGTTDQFYAVLMLENRTGAAYHMEVDYFGARGWRDWTP